MENPVKPLDADTLDAYALALGTGDSYAAQLAAFLNGCIVPPGDAEEPALVVEEPDF
jgi:hypothetical protein